MRGVLRVSGLSTIVVATLIAGCGSSSQKASAPPTHDGAGDPFITEAQGRAIRIGESAAAAFRTLGGEADSGLNGQQAPPTRSYDYPITGTGNAESDKPFGHEKALWWQLCISPENRVVSKERGKLESLSECRESES